MGQEQFCDPRCAGCRFCAGTDRHHQRGRAVERVLDVHVGAAIDEQFDDVEVAVVAGVDDMR